MRCDECEKDGKQRYIGPGIISKYGVYKFLCDECFQRIMDENKCG